ncbi:hypothetical protein [uncultured Draconibacterium sp.]|uniref:hypothetical protein n=1 Tax=uncultured Draconibacterium sp. TaxID=1573823 RepID=UPI0025D08EC5|nr:hypothetical protein [uncultured Draconibacterium sp.]
MTAQVFERIRYKGKTYDMADEPLSIYLEQRGCDIVFTPPHTACWRGYIGKWKVKCKKLYLYDLSGFDESDNEISLDKIFPGQKEVFADWFTEEMRLPCGKMLMYRHMGYESVYEKDIFLKFENGVLVGERVVDNQNNSDVLPW